MASATSSHGLVERVKRGDRQVFSGLFAKYRPRLAVLIHYKIGLKLRGFVDVDDVLQETLLQAFRDIQQFTYRSPGSFMNWLSRIADHVIKDQARAHGRQKRHAAEMVRFRSESNPGGPEPVDSKTPSRVFAENEGVLRLLGQLDLLPDDYRQAILLAKVEGLTTTEVAQKLGRSNEATALLLHRAIKRFRTLQSPRPR